MNISSATLSLCGFQPVLAALNVDGWILGFSAVTVIVTIWMGFRSAKKSKTASDFFVAGRSVSVGWNASAISGEYLSAASFMGIAGMVMSSGYDALWYPVCYACGYLFLLLFIAGPLRRFGAYTIPDFAEGRFDSPVFRKIAVVFVLFIGFFYTMPQMKGAGTTLAYIFPGLPYWAGVVLVGAVITLNVALGGMKGITLVQAFQYWAKMFAISVPIFVLMAVYGHYGVQLGAQRKVKNIDLGELTFSTDSTNSVVKGKISFFNRTTSFQFGASTNEIEGQTFRSMSNWFANLSAEERLAATRATLPPKAPADSTWLNPFGPLTTKAAKNAAAAIGKKAASSFSAPVMQWIEIDANQSNFRHISESLFDRVTKKLLPKASLNPLPMSVQPVAMWAADCALFTGERYFISSELTNAGVPFGHSTNLTPVQFVDGVYAAFTNHGAITHALANGNKLIVNGESVWLTNRIRIERDSNGVRLSLASVSGKVGEPVSGTASHSPTDSLTHSPIPLRSDITAEQHLTVALDSPTVAQALGVYAELTGRKLVPNTNSIAERVDDLLNGKLSQLKFITRGATPDSGVRFHADGLFTAGEVKAAIEAQLRTNGLALVAAGASAFRVERISREGGEGSEVRDDKKSSSTSSPSLPSSASRETPVSAEKAWLAKHEKPLALLYTYSLIIAIVCGTAGLPHILVRFYTNPDGVAAKRTTMWVMILIGVFYVFPPVFGVLGRNLMPDLYNGIGAKGTDKIVLELPRILNAKYPPLGSILSGITCAGAFAAFMSTFSGLLVSMTGALAHDVYGRILRPKSSPEQRMKMFKIGAVILGGVAIVLGSFVEKLEINFMVGQAFAIAASSYFPLLFMAVWWRKLTMRGAAAGMLGGGLLAMVAISLTSFSTLAAGTDKTAAMFAMFKPLNPFWAEHPLARILCEQPAIWAVPLAITLMIIVSKLTAKTIPSDIRMKMLVLHAPEQLGLKQEYIQEHQAGH